MLLDCPWERRLWLSPTRSLHWRLYVPRVCSLPNFQGKLEDPSTPEQVTALPKMVSPVPVRAAKTTDTESPAADGQKGPLLVKAVKKDWTDNTAALSAAAKSSKAAYATCKKTLNFGDLDQEEAERVHNLLKERSYTDADITGEQESVERVGRDVLENNFGCHRYLWQKLTTPWNLRKIFGIDGKFGSAEFVDEQHAVEYQHEQFKQKYLQNRDFLAANLGDALKDMEHLINEQKRVLAYKNCNVYIHVSNKIVLDSEPYARYQRLLDDLKRWQHLVGEFEQRIRDIPSAKIHPENPSIQPYMPYITRVRADPACKSMEEESAKNLECLALNARQNLLSADPQFSSPDTYDKIRKETLEAIRWQAYQYVMLPGSQHNPQDRRSWVNQHFGVSPQTASALLAALNTTGAELWQEFIVPKETDALIPKLSPMAILSDPVPFPVMKIKRTWQEVHQEISGILRDVSPKLGSAIDKLYKEGRILWTRAPAAAYTQFSSYDGGKDAGATMIATDEANPSALYGKTHYYATAAITSTWNKQDLYNDAREMFINHLIEAIVDEARMREQAPGEFSKMLRNMNALMTYLRSLVLATYIDQFEDKVLRLCDKLGPLRRVRPRPRALLPAADKVDQFYDQLLEEMGARVIDFGDKKKLPYLAFAAKIVRQPHNVITSYNFVPFEIDRSNYQTMLNILAHTAVRYALKLPGTDRMPAAERELIIDKILHAPVSADFNEFIRILGGNPESEEYWSKILKDTFKPMLEEFRCVVQSHVSAAAAEDMSESVQDSAAPIAEAVQ